MEKKLLILSDIHYPIGTLALVRHIVKSERPDNVVLLGDNIELDLFKDHERAYNEFFSGFNKIFPIKKSIIILGDNDYQYAESKEVVRIIEAYKPINRSREHMIFFKKGSMSFFHGNLEKSKVVETLGYLFVMATRRINERIAPRILSLFIRRYFHVGEGEYLFLGHLHYLGRVGMNTFCGTLNSKAVFFPHSLGYVTILHNDFKPIPESIQLHRIKRLRTAPASHN